MDSFPLLLVVLSSLVSSETCIDKKNNVFRMASTNTPRPVQVSDVAIYTYDEDLQPSCKRGQANIVAPGVFRFASGAVLTDRDYDLFKSGVVKITASREDEELCKDGRSQLFMVPDNYCRFEFLWLMPEDVTRILQSKGRHTLEELEKKIHFNRTLDIPEGPSFLGIRLLDILGGRFRVVVTVEAEGQPIAEFSAPAGSGQFQIHA